MGGIDRSLVFSEHGELIPPTSRSRSRTGAHGEDIYVLPDGENYIVVSFSRSNALHWDVRVRKVSPHKVVTDLFAINDRYETWGKATEEVRKFLELAAAQRWPGAKYIQDVLDVLSALDKRD